MQLIFDGLEKSGLLGRTPASYAAGITSETSDSKPFAAVYTPQGGLVGSSRLVGEPFFQRFRSIRNGPESAPGGSHARPLAEWTYPLARTPTP